MELCVTGSNSVVEIQILLVGCARSDVGCSDLTEFEEMHRAFGQIPYPRGLNEIIVFKTGLSAELVEI